MASAIVAAPGANAMPQEVIGDLASLAANPVQNARALLRNALPVDNKQIREVQRKIESISRILAARRAFHRRGGLRERRLEDRQR